MNLNLIGKDRTKLGLFKALLYSKPTLIFHFTVYVHFPALTPAGPRYTDTLPRLHLCPNPASPASIDKIPQ